MNPIKLSGVILLLVLLCACTSTHQENLTTKSDFSGQLTDEEISNGVLIPEILWKFGRLGEVQLSPDGSVIVYSVTRYDANTNEHVTDLFKQSVQDGEAEKLTSSDGAYYNPRWTPDGLRIGFITSKSGTQQIWEMNPDGSDLVQVSDHEGGINSFEYSPDGGHILFTSDVKIDVTVAELYPDLPLANVKIIDDLMYRHWNDWTDENYSHIFFAPISEKKMGETTDIMPGEAWDSPLSPYFDASEISWSKDGKYIAYTCKKLTGKEYAVSTNSDIYLYSLESGGTKNLTGGMAGYDKYPVFSNDGKKIAFESMETPGYEADKKRLMLYDLESGEMTYLTEKFDQDATQYIWSENDEEIWFISGIHATCQIYKINVNDLMITQITKGTHDYTSFMVAGGNMIGTKMSMRMASEVFRINPDNGEETQLTLINQHIYDHIEMGQVEERWVKTTDDKDMLVWVIYPPGFDQAKQYPALLYCQGGPQSALSQYFSYRWNFQMMAANDYIIVAPNRRGLPSFGHEWNLQISGDYGGQNMKDYFSAIDELKKEPFIDENKLGCVGASYGGYSAFWLAGHHEKRFKAFIAHCGIFNFESMYGETEEMFFVNFDYEGPYWQNPKPKSYEFSPHLAVQNWDTPILIVTGQNDFRIPYTQSMEAFNAAQLLGVPSKLLFFPDEYHFVTKPQNAILWQREFFGWLDTYLKE
jgi:dipeptidyl aminopeptidase/acylaminoacyl peptidase